MATCIFRGAVCDSQCFKVGLLPQGCRACVYLGTLSITSQGAYTMFYHGLQILFVAAALADESFGDEV